MQDLLALLLLGYFFLVLIGASRAVGGWFDLLFFRRRLPEEYMLPIGFAVLPVLVAILGFVGLWRIPGLAIVSAVAAACKGILVVRSFIQRVRDEETPFMRKYWTAIVPCFVLILLAITKYHALHGGMSGDGDESRSILFTTAFAANALKPAFPLDFSLPVYYPYFLFETSAFLYASVHGVLFPSIPLLATTLAALVASYGILFLTAQRLFLRSPDRAFFFVSLFVTFAGMRSLLADMPALSFLTRVPIRETANFFHTGIHYFFAVCLCILATVLCWQGMERREKDACVLAAGLTFLGFGFSGIPVVWMGCGIVVLLGIFLLRKRAEAIRFIGTCLPSTILLAIVFLSPLFANFLPRQYPVAIIEGPHSWFQRDFAFFAEQNHLASSIGANILFAVAAIFLSMGFCLFVGFCSAPFIALLRRSKQTDPVWHALFPITIVLLVSWLLPVFTTGTSNDWTARGFLVPIVFSAFVASAIFSTMIASPKTRWSASIIVGLIVIFQGTIFLRDTFAQRSSRPSETVAHLQAALPFGSIVFVPKQSEADSEAILAAGRAVIMEPPPSRANYLLDHTILESIFQVTDAFVPCIQSRYGRNTPTGVFVLVTDKKTMITERCPS